MLSVYTSWRMHCAYDDVKCQQNKEFSNFVNARFCQHTLYQFCCTFFSLLRQTINKRSLSFESFSWDAFCVSEKKNETTSKKTSTIEFWKRCTSELKPSQFGLWTDFGICFCQQFSINEIDSALCFEGAGSLLHHTVNCIWYMHFV